MKDNNKSLFVVTSSINLSTDDTKTVFAVVGVADNKEIAKEMNRTRGSIESRIRRFYGIVD